MMNWLLGSPFITHHSSFRSLVSLIAGLLGDLILSLAALGLEDLEDAQGGLDGEGALVLGDGLAQGLFQLLGREGLEVVGARLVGALARLLTGLLALLLAGLRLLAGLLALLGVALLAGVLRVLA